MAITMGVAATATNGARLMTPTMANLQHRRIRPHLPAMPRQTMVAMLLLAMAATVMLTTTNAVTAVTISVAITATAVITATVVTAVMTVTEGPIMPTATMGPATRIRRRLASSLRR